jgi:hypothetical protein
MKGIVQTTKGEFSGFRFRSGRALEGELILETTGFNFNKQVSGKKVSVFYNANVEIDASTGNIFELVLSGNVSALDAVNLQEGGTYLFVIKQDSSGSHTVAFSSKFHFEGGTAPTITATANAVDVVSAVYVDSVLLCSIMQDIKAT